MSVPFLDLAQQHAALNEEIHQALSAVIAHGCFINGPETAAFERDFAQACSAEHCIGVANGTDALHIALRASGVGPGHEVIIPAMSFAATAEAVVLAGATPVFADCLPDSHTLAPRQAEAAITPRTRAMIPVHLYGHPADIATLSDLAAAHRLALIQDCAQAHGATLGSRPLASFGGIQCYSFYPGKVLGALGDAGAVVTNDPELARWMRMFANHGRQGKYDHLFSGTNSRLDSIQAAVLGLKLRNLPQWLEGRRRVAAQYARFLAKLPGLELPVLPLEDHALHLYVVLHPRRDALKDHLQKHGIGCGVHYPTCLPDLPAFSPYGGGDFPNARRLQERCLSLPIYPEMTEGQVQEVARAVTDFVTSQDAR